MNKPPRKRIKLTPLIDKEVLIDFGIEKGWLPKNYKEGAPVNNSVSRAVMITCSSCCSGKIFGIRGCSCVCHKKEVRG